MTDQQILELQNKFIGKRVLVKTEKGNEVGGICNYIGYNKFFPNWGLQITVDRLPIKNVKALNIKLVK